MVCLGVTLCQNNKFQILKEFGILFGGRASVAPELTKWSFL